MAIVVHHQRVADALGIEARARGAKGSQAYGDVEDAIGTRLKWREEAGAIVRSNPASSCATAQGGSARGGESLQEPATADVRVSLH